MERNLTMNMQLRLFYYYKYINRYERMCPSVNYAQYNVDNYLTSRNTSNTINSYYNNNMTTKPANILIEETWH